MTTSGSTEASLPQRFFGYFQHEITALQEQMNRLADTALVGGERTDASDHCLAGIARLSSEVKDASSYLPPHDQRTYAEAIKALQDKLQEIKAQFNPKPRFTFKTARKSPSAISISDAAELAAQARPRIPGYLSPGNSSPNVSIPTTPAYLKTPPNEKDSPQSVPPPPPPTAVDQDKEAESSSRYQPNPARPYLSSNATSVTISNKSNNHIILPASGSHNQTPCSIANLMRCVLDLSSPSTATTPFATLSINNISSSLLLCGAVSGPAHITGVSNTKILISCHQFRMHECSNVDVYLYCTSKPIIENCSGIYFSELPTSYNDILSSATSDQNESATPQKGRNQWDQVEDFKWLKSEPSPNWSTLPAERKIQDDTWREIVPGGPGWSLDEILRAVGIDK